VVRHRWKWTEPDMEAHKAVAKIRHFRRPRTRVAAHKQGPGSLKNCPPPPFRLPAPREKPGLTDHDAAKRLIGMPKELFGSSKMW